MTFPAARRLRSALVACAAALAFGLAVPHPVRAQEGAAAVQDVTLTDVVLPLGATVIKVPKLTASGTRLSRDDLAAIFKADASEPWAVRLARLDAASLTAPVLDSEHAGPGDQRQSATYRDVVARDVRGGRIGELTASGVTLSSKGTKAAPDAAGTYGAFRATDVDLASFARLALEPGDGKGPTLRVYGTMQLSDIAISDAKGTTVKVARWRGAISAPVRCRRAGTAPSILLSRGFDDPEPSAARPPPLPTCSARRPSAASTSRASASAIRPRSLCFSKPSGCSTPPPVPMPGSASRVPACPAGPPGRGSARSP